MGSFSADWLTLREPVDHRSRSKWIVQSLEREISAAVGSNRRVPAHRSNGSRLLSDDAAADTHSSKRLSVLDLGAGTGSNVRFLTAQGLRATDWCLADHDAGLLEIAAARLPFPVSTRTVDLIAFDQLTALMNALSDADHGNHLSDTDHSERPAEADDSEQLLLVTASALLDLVSDSWLQELLSLCGTRRALVLFALSYDGRLLFDPAEEGAELIRTLFNRHQCSNKGFGPALGPAASQTAVRRLTDLGYRTLCERSDWQLDSADAQLQRQLLDGFATASYEADPLERKTIECWLDRRLELVEEGRSRLVVGHEDIGGFISAPTR